MSTYDKLCLAFALAIIWTPGFIAIVLFIQQIRGKS